MNDSDPRNVCLLCGASNPADASRCWLCQAELKAVTEASPVEAEPAGEGENPFASPMELPSQQSGDVWLSVGSVVLLVALSVVGAGIHLVLGAVMFVLGLPALIATLIIAGRRRRQGRPLTAGKKVQVFIGSMFVTFLVLIAATIALFIVCFAVVLAESPVFR